MDIDTLKQLAGVGEYKGLQLLLKKTFPHWVQKKDVLKKKKGIKPKDLNGLDYGLADPYDWDVPVLEDGKNEGKNSKEFGGRINGVNTTLRCWS